MVGLLNPLLYLMQKLFELALCVFLLRILLQLVRADFYNPISQLVWKLTQPAVGAPARHLKRWKRFDIAGAVVLLALAIVYVWVISQFGVGGYQVSWPMMVRIALIKIVSLTIYVYLLSLFAMAILSWVGPGVSNPTANVLWSLNEPLLRPVRRLLPPISGLDVSPIPVMLILFTLNQWLAPFLGAY